MEHNSIIYNRLIKNRKKLRKWLDKNHIKAYRLYDKDMPEFPYIVDVYNQQAVLYEKGTKDVSENTRQKSLNQMIEAICDVLNIEEKNIIFKVREVKKQTNQYEKESTENNRIIVNEGKLSFYVNLHDYLDTGLFLDHRPLRQALVDLAHGKRCLNLFAYTGSLSVAMGIKASKVTTVDMSKTYINWAIDNFRLNDIQFSKHEFVAKNVFTFLKMTEEKYDLIVCDPPSFSNSKRMDGTFDVGRDHRGLIDLCMSSLKPDGVLYFSNNLRKFKLDEDVLKSYQVIDKTHWSIPQDFRDHKIHSLFEIRMR
jgi:23S rRNA (cytosine1962-C5)-methyltransferase